MTQHDVLKNHLDSLRGAIPEVRGVLLASDTGLPIAHSFANGSDPNRVAAIAAAASTLGRRISAVMASGGLAEVCIRCDDGSVFIYSAGPKAILAVLGGAGSSVGLIHLEARSVAKSIEGLISKG